MVKIYSQKNTNLKPQNDQYFFLIFCKYFKWITLNFTKFGENIATKQFTKFIPSNVHQIWWHFCQQLKWITLIFTRYKVWGWTECLRTRNKTCEDQEVSKAILIRVGVWSKNKNNNLFFTRYFYRCRPIVDIYKNYKW